LIFFTSRLYLKYRIEKYLFVRKIFSVVIIKSTQECITMILSPIISMVFIYMKCLSIKLFEDIRSYFQYYIYPDDKLSITYIIRCKRFYDLKL
jgi:hypothetical protein